MLNRYLVMQVVDNTNNATLYKIIPFILKWKYFTNLEKELIPLKRLINPNTTNLWAGPPKLFFKYFNCFFEPLYFNPTNPLQKTIIYILCECISYGKTLKIIKYIFHYCNITEEILKKACEELYTYRWSDMFPLTIKNKTHKFFIDKLYEYKIMNECRRYFYPKNIKTFKYICKIDNLETSNWNTKRYIYKILERNFNNDGDDYIAYNEYLMRKYIEIKNTKKNIGRDIKKTIKS